MPDTFPMLRSVVLDATDARGLAEFYRQLLGYEYRPGDEPPPRGQPDEAGGDWLVLVDPAGAARLVVDVADGRHPPAAAPRPQRADLGRAGGPAPARPGPRRPDAP